MPKETSTELAFPAATELEAVYTAIMDGSEIELAPADAESVLRDYLHTLQNAETAEEALATQDIEGWSDYEGVPVFIVGLKFNKSTKNEGKKGTPSVYAVVELRRADDGESLRVTAGGQYVMLYLVTAVQKGWLDTPVKLVSQGTGGGNTVHRLIPA